MLHIFECLHLIFIVKALISLLNLVIIKNFILFS